MRSAAILPTQRRPTLASELDVPAAQQFTEDGTKSSLLLLGW
jgi:hypothetical protein